MTYKVEQSLGWMEFYRFRGDPLNYISKAAQASIDVRCMLGVASVSVNASRAWKACCCWPRSRSAGR